MNDDDITRARKLILLLSSDQPGEVFAAAKAFRALLAKNNLDVYFLADALEERCEIADIMRLYNSAQDEIVSLQAELAAAQRGYRPPEKVDRGSLTFRAGKLAGLLYRTGLLPVISIGVITLLVVGFNAVTGRETAQVAAQSEPEQSETHVPDAALRSIVKPLLRHW